MAVYSMKCPHCNTEDVLFTSVADAIIQKIEFFSVSKDVIASSTYNVFMQCNHCLGGCVLFVKMQEDCEISPHRLSSGIEFKRFYKVFDMAPKCAEQTAPEFVSSNVSRFYLQALDSFQRNNFDAAGMMFRKVLDVATKEIGATNGSIKTRIDKLAESHQITPAMQEWAHAIRLDGNEAAHEEEPFNNKTCDALKSFTELFLVYAFTLPGMLKKRRAVKSS